MPNITVNLTEKHAEFVRKVLDSGFYADESKVIQMTLERLQEDDQVLLDLQKRLLKSWEQAERGELIDGRKAMREAWRKVQESVAKKSVNQ